MSHPSAAIEGPTACGTFRVRLSDLKPTADASSLRLLNRTRVRQLVGTFQVDKGYKDVLAKNRLQGRVVLDERLPTRDALLSHSKIGWTGRRAPKWKWGPVYYLEGRHRLEAARKYSRTSDDQIWWTVDVHAAGQLNMLRSV